MPQIPRSAPLPESAALYAAIHAHFRQVIVPLWQGPGWNSELALPYEALDAGHRPLAAQRYRAMACARQLYLFASLIGDSGFADAQSRAADLFHSLQRHFHDAEHGGWFYSIDPEGAPLDTRKDLYTHAFIIFACAHYWVKVHEPQVESVLDDALQLVTQRFARDGLYEASLERDWSSLGSGPLQNPLMHLAEAFLATLAARDDAAVRTALLALVDGLQHRFIAPEEGVMLEKPLGAVDNWFEPGHQFEWFYLLESSPLLQGCALQQSLNRAFDYAERNGVDPKSGAVGATLELGGCMRDATQRIWAQAEYLRALTVRPDHQPRLQRQLLALQQRFLPSAGWYECLDADGNVSRQDMPSTTPYHLATCLSGLAEYF